MATFKPSTKSDIQSIYAHPIAYRSTHPPARTNGIKGALLLGGLPAAAVSAYFLVSGPLAPILSYRRNQSIPWAIGAFLIAPIYVGYVAFDTIADRMTK